MTNSGNCEFVGKNDRRQHDPNISSQCYYSEESARRAVKEKHKKS